MTLAVRKQRGGYEGDWAPSVVACLPLCLAQRAVVAWQHPGFLTALVLRSATLHMAGVFLCFLRMRQSFLGVLVSLIFAHFCHRHHHHCCHCRKIVRRLLELETRGNPCPVSSATWKGGHFHRQHQGEAGVLLPGERPPRPQRR